MYIGKTIDETSRKRRHYRNALTVVTPFYTAVRKYGWEGFYYTIFYKIIGTDKLKIDSIIKNKEKELIEYYNTTVTGYNCTLGGDGSCGCYPSLETRKKQSERQLGKKRPNSRALRKPVIQLTLNDEFIKEWKSVADAAKAVNAPSQHISRCCHNERKQTRGYKWKFKI